MPTKLMTAITKASPRTVGPTIVGMALRSGAAKAATMLMRQPSSGRSGIAQRSVGWNSFTVPPQQVEGAGIDALGVTEYRDDDRKADGGLGRGHRHHEEHEDLALDPDAPRDRDERKVHRVQHELDAHEQDDRIASENDAGDTEREQDRTQPE